MFELRIAGENETANGGEFQSELINTEAHQQKQDGKVEGMNGRQKGYI